MVLDITTEMIFLTRISSSIPEYAVGKSLGLEISFFCIGASACWYVVLDGKVSQFHDIFKL